MTAINVSESPLCFRFNANADSWYLQRSLPAKCYVRSLTHIMVFNQHNRRKSLFIQVLLRPKGFTGTLKSLLFHYYKKKKHQQCTDPEEFLGLYFLLRMYALTAIFWWENCLSEDRTAWTLCEPKEDWIQLPVVSAGPVQLSEVKISLFDFFSILYIQKNDFPKGEEFTILQSIVVSTSNSIEWW